MLPPWDPGPAREDKNTPGKVPSARKTRRQEQTPREEEGKRMPEAGPNGRRTAPAERATLGPTPRAGTLQVRGPLA